jgi:hypothetical protein
LGEDFQPGLGVGHGGKMGVAGGEGEG